MADQFAHEQQTPSASHAAPGASTAPNAPKTAPKTAEKAGAKPAAKRRKRREWPYRLSVVVLVLAGIAVTLFPVIGTYYNNWHQLQFANSQVAQQGGDAASNAHWLAMARAYNQTLPPGDVSDPWTGKDQSRNPAYQAYLKQLSETQAMARVRIPSIHVTLPVYHGTSDESLELGAGHMFGTSLPVGGTGTHAAIAAHRGLPNMTGFDNLPDLKLGDQFFIDVYGQTLAYAVSNIQTVLPTDVKPLKRVAGQDLVTFITCTPYGINTHRLLVTGHRIPLSQASQATWHQSFDWTIQHWMYTRLAIALAALLLLLALAIKWIHDDARRRRRIRARLAAANTAEAPQRTAS